MIKRFLACIIFITSISNQLLFAQNETDVINYITRFKKFAIEEQLRTGVPASITLAQGIHETAAGNSDLAMQANNHFGIKCKSNWTGETMLHDDDKKQECFRKYPNPQQSYIDHSDFLRAGSRYQFLFEIEATDYVGWASGLRKAGYATNPGYVKKLTDLVERYNLQQYTYDALTLANRKPGEIVPERDAKNPDIVADPNTSYKGLKGFWAKQGETLQEKAAQYDIKYARLLDFNDLQDEPLPADMFVFLEKKKKTGTVEFHMVKEDENMHIISQKEAMNLANLYTFNQMKKGEEPLPGEQLALQYRSYNSPKIIQREAAPVEARMVEPDVKITKPEPVKETAPNSPLAGTTDIIDVEKAKKVEALLVANKDAQSEIQITQQEVVKPITEIKKPEPKVKKETVQKTETPVKAEAIVQAEPEPAVEPKVEKKPAPVMPKRFYNEKNVDESVKVLKERFDNLVYRPFERRVIAVPAKELPKAETVKAGNTGAPKETAVKKEVKKETPAKAVVNEEVKNTNVEKTKTGVVRDARKIEEDKKKAKEAQLAAAKKDPKKGTAKTPDPAAKKTDNEVLQKGSKTAVKKTPEKKETAAPSKAKKEDVKKADNKKAEAKKAEVKKKEIKKK